MYYAGMTLTVLGCATPYPRPDEPCSGFLIRTPHHAVWVDAGSGTLAELQRHTTLGEIDAIWISHLHPDHSSDVLAAWSAYVNTPSLGRPTVFGPPGWNQRFDTMIGRPQASEEAFTVAELHDGHDVDLGGLQLRAVAVRHSVPTFGLRARYDNRILAYSADSGPGEQMTALAYGAELLVIECGADEPQRYHCTPDEAGAIATAADARRVVLTHLVPGLAASSAVARARACFSGEVWTAERGMIVTV
jgi:ribonuclease BN (tRNA processing enzyme)